MALVKLGSVKKTDLVLSGSVNLASDCGSTILPVANGGTGSGSFTDGQLLIGNTTGNTLTKSTLTGTANQVTVTNGSGSITLSLPQNIATSSSPTFAGLTVTSGADIDGVYVGQRTVKIASNVFVGTNNSVITTGSNNTGIGDGAVHDVTSGIANTGVGANSLGQVTTGSYNSAIGYDSLHALTTGSYCVGLGRNALHDNVSGNASIGIGYSAGHKVTGDYVIAIGSAALENLASGNGTVSIGQSAGQMQADGVTVLGASTNSVYLGYGVRGFDDTDSNAIVIGASAIGEGPNTTTVGNSSTVSCHLFGTLKIGDGADETKTATFDCSGITTGTNRTVTLPDASGTMTLLGNASTGSGSVVLATSPALVTPNIGTPSAGTLTNCTGLPVASGISGLGTGIATFLGTPSSANLAAAVTDETGTGSLVFSDSPTFTGTVNGAAVTLTGNLQAVSVTGEYVTCSKNQNLNTSLAVSNTTNNTAARAELRLASQNASGAYSGLFAAFSSSYSAATLGADCPGNFVFLTSGLGTPGLGFAVRNASGHIRFYTNASSSISSTNVRLDIDPAGNILAGTSTTPSGATYNHVLGGGSTSPVLGAATADMVSTAAIDVAAGDRQLYAMTEGNQSNRLTGLSCYVSTAFSKTSDTTLANVTGLTRNVRAGEIYALRAVLFTESNVAGGVKFAIGGTATATSIIAGAKAFDGTGMTVAVTTQRATALGGAFGDVTAVTVAEVQIDGQIVVNAAGTLTVQFAQNASNGTASTVKAGSYFELISIGG